MQTLDSRYQATMMSYHKMELHLNLCCTYLGKVVQLKSWVYTQFKHCLHAPLHSPLYLGHTDSRQSQSCTFSYHWITLKLFLKLFSPMVGKKYGCFIQQIMANELRHARGSIQPSDHYMNTQIFSKKQDVVETLPKICLTGASRDKILDNPIWFICY